MLGTPLTSFSPQIVDESISYPQSCDCGSCRSPAPRLSFADMSEHALRDRVSDLLRPTGEEDLLRVDYPSDTRVGLRKTQAIAGALALLICALIFGVVTLTKTKSAGEDSQVSASAASSSIEPLEPTAFVPLGLNNPASTQSTPAEPTEELVVSVMGNVEYPGLVTLTAEARVADALTIAVLKPDSDLLALNQARKLSDGEQIYVPRVGEELPPALMMPSPLEPMEPAGGAGSGNGTGSLGGGGIVNLNTAGVAELNQLPGVGEKTAQAIIAHREAIGGFRSIEQLLEVKGIGPSKFEKMRAHLKV